MNLTRLRLILLFFWAILIGSEVNAQPCSNPPAYDFGYDQNLCSPKTIQFSSNLTGVQSFQWQFGDGQTNTTSLSPIVTYSNYGNYDVKLIIQYSTNCRDTLTKSIPVKSTFDNSIITNADTSICFGDSLLIRTATNQLNYCWKTSTGQSIPVKLSEYVKPSETTTYYLNTQTVGNNLVKNGDFSQGNTGFSSGYVSAYPNTTEGEYWIGGSPNSWNPGLSLCNDHTTGTGNMMMINGSPILNVKMWSQTVTVLPNTDYTFSVWIQSLYAVNPANLRFSINNNIVGNNITAGPVCNWNRFSTSWNSGNSTSAVITIVNNNTIVLGNDFAIDDIFFGQNTTKNDSFQVKVNSVPAVSAGPDAVLCLGESRTLNATGAISYNWLPSTGLSNVSVNNPIATPVVTTNYIVTGADQNGCKAKDTVVLTVNQCITASASFTIPDTVCVNTPVTISNTSSGASSYYWNFCVASLNTTPDASNIGNPGGLSSPVFIDYAFDNGNYYGFLINYNPGRLIRLNFGPSLLNIPTSTDLGNFGGTIPTGAAAEGIQIVFNEGKWYAIIVGGNPAAGNTPRILKVDFGSNLSNSTPIATNWGNLGNMLQPIDLHVFKEGSNWYGLTVNAENNTITRFNFTNSFDNVPTAVSLGNIGNLKYPTGIYAINDNGFWRVFVVNGGDNTRTSSNCSITRLDFGSSLLNTPTGTNLGNPGNKLQHPRDLTIMKLCGEIIGFAVNGNPNYNDIVKLNFNNNLSAVPVITSLGNIGNLNFPHSISKLFRVNNDVYSFITNVANNTITRIRFQGCSSTSVPNSNLQNPPSLAYSTPGTYSINLTVDEGLATQSAACKQIVVLPELQHTPIQTVNLCEGESIKIGRMVVAGRYTWNTGATTDSIEINTAGTYWIETNRYGCSNRDSFLLIINAKPSIRVRQDTSICKGESIVLTSQTTGNNIYSWSPTVELSNASVESPMATPTITTEYIVSVTNGQGCMTKDTVTINVNEVPQVSLGSDAAFCKGDSLVLNASNTGGVFQWQDFSTHQTFIAKDSGFYYVTVTKQGCASSDSIHLSFNPTPVFSIMHDTAVCAGKTIVMQMQSLENYSYIWAPTTGLSGPSSSPTIIINDTIRYIAIATNNFNCTAKDTINIFSLKVPIVELGHDTAICQGSTLTLDAQNPGAIYLWNNGIVSQVNMIANPGVYKVLVTKDGCSAEDSININLRPASVFKMMPSAANVCLGDSIKLTASGGNKYEWFADNSPLNIFDSSLTVRPSTSTTYNVNVKDACEQAGRVSSVITVMPLPVISITKSNDISCALPQAQLFATGGKEYSWSPAINMSQVNIPNPVVSPTADIWYKVRVKGDNGCINQDSIKILSSFVDGGKFHVPNAFSPNHDGKNDCFGVTYWQPVDYFELSIYNRWGERVFYTTKNQCWDGYYKGRLQPSDVYVYIIKARSICGNVNKKGTLALIN